MTARLGLERIMVIGGGQVAWLAAIALKRAVPNAAVSIAGAPVAEQALADRAHTTLPSLARLHARIGMDEAGMMARADASHRLATLYHGWSKDDVLLGYGAATSSGGFSRQWSGEATATDSAVAASGVAGALALAERFAHPSDDATSPLSDLDYGLRFDPTLHLRRLKSLAAHLGIGEAPASRPGQCDLVIDTRCPAVRDAWIDWSRQMPGRTVAINLAPSRLSTLDEATAASKGYTIVSPGRDATRVYSVSFDSANRGGFELKSGRTSEAWIERTVLIGDAASAFEPLGWCNLHLAICQIELLLELLPGRDIEPIERDEYNRRAGDLADRVRDFVALHYGTRADIERSPGLMRTLGEFARRGRLPFFEEESVPRDLWMQLLRAVRADHDPPPSVLAMPNSKIAAMHDAQQRRVSEAVTLAEPYDVWFARHAKAVR